MSSLRTAWIPGACFLAASVLMPVIACVTEEELALASKGKSNCSIIVNYGPYESAEEASRASGDVEWFDTDLTDDNICTESFAAVELRNYLCKMYELDNQNPENFPVCDDDQKVDGNLIIIGNDKTNKQCAPYKAALDATAEGEGYPCPEGFRVKAVKNGDGFIILLAGCDRAGTLYAVYDFLNTCGVRWFSPGLAGEVVYGKKALRLKSLDYTDYPMFKLRGYWVSFLVPEHMYEVPEGKKGNPDFFNWMARNRMNLWSDGERGVPPGELKKRCFHLNNGGHHFYLLLHPDKPYPYNHPDFKGDEEKGPDPYAVGDEYRGDVNKDGILSYSEAHPEWYGLAPDGERKFPRDPFGWNFCTSNKDLLAELLKNLIARLADGEWKNADYLDWWPQDADLWCVCEECKKLGSPTDRNILMAHQIRQALKEAFRQGRLDRDIKVNFLFYSGSGVIDPPTRPLPDNFDYDNILATFFPINRCYVHTFDDPACTEFNKEYQDYFQAWLLNPYYHGKFMVGEYYNISGFRDLPILYTGVMDKDIRYFYESGARAMHYMHIPIGNWGPRALTNYQFARMLWNPDLDVARMLDEYFRLRYENAQTEMRCFYTSLEKTMINVPMYKYQLRRALIDYSDGKTDNIFQYKHLHFEEYHPETDDGPDMVETLAELQKCEAIMNQALTLRVSPKVRKQILEDEGLFRYAANTIRLYYHLSHSTMLPLRSPEWKREIERASYYADLLNSQPVGFAAHYGGTMGMMRNALEASYIKEVYEKWRGMLE